MAAASASDMVNMPGAWEGGSAQQAPFGSATRTVHPLLPFRGEVRAAMSHTPWRGLCETCNAPKGVCHPKLPAAPSPAGGPSSLSVLRPKQHQGCSGGDGPSQERMCAPGVHSSRCHFDAPLALWFRSPQPSPQKTGQEDYQAAKNSSTDVEPDDSRLLHDGCTSSCLGGLRCAGRRSAGAW